MIKKSLYFPSWTKMPVQFWDNDGVIIHKAVMTKDEANLYRLKTGLMYSDVFLKDYPTNRKEVPA